jgi:capsular exopolysaccharide synthesis family protein
MTHTQLASEISASTPSNTVLMNLTVTDKYTRRAQQIATVLAHQYIRVIDSLESKPGQTAPVRVTVSSPASYSDTPASPRKSLDVGLGLLLGLLIGIGAANALERLDDTISSEDELREVFGLTVLAEIPNDPSASEGLLAKGKRTTMRLEALRSLRTSLRYINVDDPPHCFVVTSCDVSVGKSVTSSSLAAVMSDSGNDVVVVEGDLRRPRLRSYLLAPHRTEGLADVLTGDLGVDDLLFSVPRESKAPGAGRLDLLAASGFVPNPSELLGSQRMRALCDELRVRYSTVIIDTPPVLAVTDALILATVADGVLLVVQYGATSRRDLRRTLDFLEQVHANVLGVLVNKVQTAPEYYGYSYEAASAEPRTDPASTSSAHITTENAHSPTP